MKVSELIAKLQRAPPDAEVTTEGCDCNGDCAYVLLDDGEILLGRSDSFASTRLDNYEQL